MKRMIFACLLALAFATRASYGAESLQIIPANYLDDPASWAKAAPAAGPVKLAASPGEYEPLAFAVVAGQAAQKVTVEAGALNGPAVIPAAELSVCAVAKQWDENETAVLRESGVVNLV